MIELESLEDVSVEGFYFVQVCDYPTIAPKARANHVFRFNPGLGEQFGQTEGWFEKLHGSRAYTRVYGWYGPLRLRDMEVLDDPSEMGYYAVLLQPWPNQSPKFKEFRVCVWRRNAWYDQYGWAKQYGNVLGWIGPFPMLPEAPPWLKQHEKEEAEDIGL